jgi:hypothetical protein
MSGVASIIGGHPSILAHRDELGLAPMRLSMCAGCERVKTIMFLSRDRWLCTHCRAEGDARPTQIPLRRPK